jgi:quercetin dioxygenase-like cupin family protein
LNTAAADPEADAHRSRRLQKDVLCRDLEGEQSLIGVLQQRANQASLGGLCSASRNQETSIMREVTRALLLICLSFSAVPALANPEAIVTPLIAKSLPEVQGKEGVMILVEYPPGASDPIHRHDAHAFVYVLEGTIVMQLQNAAEVTLSAGQTYYEGPSDLHVVGRNASNTQPAKFVVFLVKNQGAPILTPVK